MLFSANQCLHLFISSIFYLPIDPSSYLSVNSFMDIMFVRFQDTNVALQALAKYSEKTSNAKLDLQISIQSINTAKNVNHSKLLLINKDNAFMQQSVDVSSLRWDELEFYFSGLLTFMQEFKMLKVMLRRFEGNFDSL